MRLLVVIALAGCTFACSRKGASFEGAKLSVDQGVAQVPADKQQKLEKSPPTAAPFSVTETQRADWQVGEGMLLTIWHERGNGDGSEVRKKIERERQPLPVAPNMRGFTIRDLDELSETPNYLLWKRHTQLPAGLGINERYILAKDDEGSLHRWSAGCFDLLQEGRCPKIMDTFALEDVKGLSAP